MTTETAPSREGGRAADKNAAPGRGRLADAKAPVAVAAAAWSGLVLALLALGVAVLGVQNALVHAGWVGAPSWAGTVASTVDGQTAELWLIVPGTVAVLIGLWLLFLAVKPRRSTSVRSTGGTPVFVRPLDLARWSSDTARSLPVVIEAGCTATRRRVTVRVSTAETARDHVREQVADAVRDRLEPLGLKVAVAVKVHTEKVVS